MAETGRREKERIDELEKQMEELTRLLKGHPANKSAEDNCKIGKDLFAWKQSIAKTAEYNDAKYIWFILSYMTFLLNPTYPNFIPPPLPLPLSNAQDAKDDIKYCLDQLEKANPNWKADLADQCAKLHRLLCGHCSC